MNIPTNILGKTGRKVTMFGLGGEGILRTTGNFFEAEQVIKKAVEVGVNYFDTAPAYAQSRDYLGKFLWKYVKRNQIFLASKTHYRTYDGTMDLLNDSLKRLNTDYLDLLQLHDLRTKEDIDDIFSKNGAIHALEDAKKQGKIKFFGITGHHDPEILISAINKYEFDTCLLCANAGDKYHIPFLSTVIPAARKKGMGIIGMKVLGQGSIFPTLNVKEAIYYTLSQDVDLAIIGCTTPQEVEQNANFVKNFKKLDNKEIEIIENKAKSNPNLNYFKKEI